MLHVGDNVSFSAYSAFWQQFDNNASCLVFYKLLVHKRQQDLMICPHQ